MCIDIEFYEKEIDYWRYSKEISEKTYNELMKLVDGYKSLQRDYEDACDEIEFLRDFCVI